jgi:cytochrome c-type biogenesis protein CcmH
VKSRHFPLWTLLGVVLVVALLVGSGVFSSSPQTNAQRAAALESVIRCPSCEDLSVAVSSASTAVTVRATILHMVDQGRSNQQIEDYLTARYGSSIVLDPPASGWSALVWVLPIAAGLAATSLLVWVFVRRRLPGTDVDADVRGPTVDPVALDERRLFLTQSLADADAEYLAGDLADADYLALRQRDLSRLAALGPATATLATAATTATTVAAPAVDRRAVATATLMDEPAVATGAAVVSDGSTTTRRRVRNTWFLAGAIGCFVAALALAVPLFSSDRLPGQSATGSVALSPSQQVSRALDQAAAVENQGQLGLAAQLYQAVLTAHPDNELALAQLGWLEYRIGQQGASATLVSDARAKLSRAAALDPGDYAVHLYLGTLLLQSDGNAPGAVDQFAEFLADKPPAAVVAQAASVLHQAYTVAGKPIPTGIPTI